MCSQKTGKIAIHAQDTYILLGILTFFKDLGILTYFQGLGILCIFWDFLILAYFWDI